ncbi:MULTISPECIES: competence/damage-inducible protein A [unclassified Undibacterium]|uniref:competence/damage-inducible protein A n=1 Tax=unclassified Undibacterium TaxID=2630295 RepID=UPI002AC995CF|nr:MULTISPECIES: molybdopterin-binding protein [unclassified Undibacterium]MEB0138397.1 molybdopterin-binding protein [Undibacterium sp. CCC2.1]MEB0171272.1 molybdopterin-binding protein [Undibacterium sp. CCC1.1]MEB0176490.1 molybdopterin-binding protein [Undibacterium sp. CCC3.4]MEB0214025.1 molybdopterin-binding protein [Undibacterium sp. 5I2]WPX43641.1 molybdopterin-binding protein [Undibacterium sp. CCC3.4]
MAIGLIIIGDEILSGKRQDKHLSKVIEILHARGLQLDWAEYVGDSREKITATLQRSFAGDDIVFSTGGIGATPDDHTRQGAAAALQVPLALHDGAKLLIEQRIREMAAEAGDTLNLAAPEHQQRLKMGEFPLGAQLIPNPYNRIPGFAVDRHYFVPGFPVMAWPMIEWVLDTHYPHLFHQQARAEQSVFVYEAIESVLTPLMERLEADYPLIKVFSLPTVASENQRRHIELGVKGDAAQVPLAYAAMCAGLDLFAAEYVAVTAAL